MADTEDPFRNVVRLNLPHKPVKVEARGEILPYHRFLPVGGGNDPCRLDSPRQGARGDDIESQAVVDQPAGGLPDLLSPLLCEGAAGITPRRKVSAFPCRRRKSSMTGMSDAGT